eukprot:6175324-Pleurochrysis_carterae.AAC.1
MAPRWNSGGTMSCAPGGGTSKMIPELKRSIATRPNNSDAVFACPSLFSKPCLLGRIERFHGLRDKVDGDGKRGPLRHPLSIKILASLFMLAHGLSFFIVAEMAFISEQFLRVFFHGWTQWLADEIVKEYVAYPSDPEDIRAAEAVFARLGFLGAIASTDGVQVRWNCYPSTRTWMHEGKEGYPTRGFNVSVLHSRKIIHVMDSFAGHENDKTKALGDPFLVAIRDGESTPMSSSN